ncbi:MAG: hypothetical protein Q9225_005916 [Loekoesia sp. 1 TL-2023]
MAKGLPSHDLTPESRVLNSSMKDWHRLNNHEFDLQLDFLWAIDSPPKDRRFEQHSEIQQKLGWSMETPNQATEMQDSVNPTGVAADAQPCQATTGANHPTPMPEGTDNPLSHVTNDFDDPQYHIQDSHADEHGSISMEQAHSSSSSEAKEEPAASVGMNPSSLAIASSTHPEAQGTHDYHRMQRGLTDSNVQPSTSWSSGYSHGLPAANGGRYQGGGMHQELHRNFSTAPSVMNSSYGRPRAQTTGLNSASFYGQQHPSYYGSQLRQSMHTNSVWGQGGTMYPPSQMSNGFPYQSNSSNGRNDLGFSTLRSSDLYAAQVSTVPSNTYDNVLAANSRRGNVNNNRLASTCNVHHNNNNQMVNPADLQIHPPQHQAYMTVPASQILKSQSPFTSDGTADGSGSTKMSSKRKPRNTVQQQPQPIDTEMEEEEIDEPETGEPDVNYPSIEAARQAERPRFRANPNKDETIPRTDREKQFMVARMVRCMRSVREAEDNEGMIKQWMKLKQDGPRVEQAAWRILDMVLQLHVEGIPLLPNKPSCNRYAKMRDRWNAICEGLFVWLMTPVKAKTLLILLPEAENNV